jgi:pimeloyl-ACP methyl ester carboxylesterase
MDTVMIETRDLRWSWQGQDVVLGLDEAGSGPLVLLLPALSSISTRGEMRPLMEQLASQFHAVAIDWPGFGARPRPEVKWTPEALSAFLDHVFHDVARGPHGVVARATRPPMSCITPRIILGRSVEQR